MQRIDPYAAFALTFIHGTAEDVERLARGDECPECATRDGLQESHSGGSFLCTACGHQWDAAEVEVTLVERVEDLATYCDGSCRKGRRY